MKLVKTFEGYCYTPWMNINIKDEYKSLDLKANIEDALY